MADEQTVDARIASALAEAAAEMRSVPKSARNDFARYGYASADDVYSAVRGPLAKAGLTVWQDEESIEFQDRGSGDKAATWIIARYAMGFDLAGVGRGRPSVHTQCAQMTGAQSMQAVATYALKYWLRGRLLLATGDRDLDAENKTDAKPPAVSRRTRRKTPTLNWRTEDDSGLVVMDGWDGDEPTQDETKRSLFQYLRTQIRDLPADMLANFMDANAAHIDSLPEAGARSLRTAAEARIPASAEPNDPE